MGETRHTPPPLPPSTATATIPCGMTCLDRMDNIEGERDATRECGCVAVIVVVGTLLGMLFVAVRESLGMKM